MENKEVKKVNYKEFYRAFHQIENQVYEASSKLNAGSVKVYDEIGSYDDFTVRLSINWSCCGAQNVEDAKAFADVLNMAVELVSNFVYNGYEVIYD